MQALSPELEAILKSYFQAGASGFNGRVEVSSILAPAEGTTTNVALTGTVTYDALADPEPVTLFSGTWGDIVPTDPTNVNDGNDLTYSRYPGMGGLLGSGSVLRRWTIDLGSMHVIENLRAVENFEHTAYWDGTEWIDFSTSWVLQSNIAPGIDSYTMTFTPIQASKIRVGSRIPNPTGTLGYWGVGDARLYELGIMGYPLTYAAISIKPKRMSIDKSLRMIADQASFEFVNEDLPLGWGANGDFLTNARVTAYQWYGDEADEVQVFTGIVDAIVDSRDPLTTVITCRDMMGILVDQTFGATAPQTTGETGVVRTMDNGVYLAMEVSDIVEDILDRAGWPTANREITPTSYVLDEYIIPDGTSRADAIIGDDVLTGLVGYSAWADELGVFHFAPTLLAGSLTEPGTPAYTFRSGEDIVSLSDSTDQYDLRTRVKVRGPLTTQTLTDTWRELWRTRKISKPVGIWYAPSEPTIIRVLDRGTKRMYRIRQSDRVVLGSTDIGAVITYPLGLSGDPSDSTIYWVLNGPWLWGSGATNQIVKVRKSDSHVLARYNLPSGNWSSIKVSGSYIYLANLSTDRIYRRSKSTGAAVDDFRHTYSSVLQSNPSGIMIDGTEINVFWSNGGTTARFLQCDESAPGTVTKRVKTAGTVLVGGEMDTTTHTECWGGSDSLGLVAKFTLVALVDVTTEVFAEVVDIDLEDELGGLAESESRVHDAHTGDAAHAFEIRRDTLDIAIVTSLAQATETAMRRLDMLSQRRRVLDTGIIGNPALQKTDLVRVEDPLTAIAEDMIIDTYRSEMTADGTYLGTLALLPVSSPDETVTDDGTATE
jgi:hypothetical protein